MFLGCLLTVLQKRMVPSSPDLLRTGQGALAVETYYLNTQKVAVYLAGMFKAAFPDYFDKYHQAFCQGHSHPRLPMPVPMPCL